MRGVSKAPARSGSASAAMVASAAAHRQRAWRCLDQLRPLHGAVDAVLRASQLPLLEQLPRMPAEWQPAAIGSRGVAGALELSDSEATAVQARGSPDSAAVSAVAALLPPFECRLRVCTPRTACIASQHAAASRYDSSSAPAPARLPINAGCHSAGVRGSCSSSGRTALTASDPCSGLSARRTASTAPSSGLSSSTHRQAASRRAALPTTAAAAALLLRGGAALTPRQASRVDLRLGALRRGAPRTLLPGSSTADRLFCAASGAKSAAASATAQGCRSASRKCATCSKVSFRKARRGAHRTFSATAPPGHDTNSVPKLKSVANGMAMHAGNLHGLLVRQLSISSDHVCYKNMHVMSTGLARSASRNGAQTRRRRGACVTDV